MDENPEKSVEKAQASGGDLHQRLMLAAESGTPSERMLAHYLASNLPSLPFETAATVAAKVGVSEASVGRFCRSIGYRHLKDLKSSLQVDLGERAWLIGDRLQDFHQRSQKGNAELARALEREVAALVTVYELAATPDFTDPVPDHGAFENRGCGVDKRRPQYGHALDTRTADRCLEAAADGLDLGHLRHEAIL